MNTSEECFQFFFVVIFFQLALNSSFYHQLMEKDKPNSGIILCHMRVTSLQFWNVPDFRKINFQLGDFSFFRRRHKLFIIIISTIYQIPNTNKIVTKIVSTVTMFRKISPNMQVFLGTTSILGFCYYTFYEMGDKSKSKSTLFDQSRCVYDSLFTYCIQLMIFSH